MSCKTFSFAMLYIFTKVQASDGILLRPEDTEDGFRPIPTILSYACCSQVAAIIKEAGLVMIRVLRSDGRLCRRAC